jgi:hypothetical protein
VIATVGVSGCLWHAETCETFNICNAGVFDTIKHLYSLIAQVCSHEAINVVQRCICISFGQSKLIMVSWRYIRLGIVKLI